MGPDWPTIEGGPTSYSDPYSDNSCVVTTINEVIKQLKDAEDILPTEPESFEPVHAIMMAAPRRRDGRPRIRHLTQRRMRR